MAKCKCFNINLNNKFLNSQNFKLSKPVFKISTIQNCTKQMQSFTKLKTGRRTSAQKILEYGQTFYLWMQNRKNLHFFHDFGTIWQSALQFYLFSCHFKRMSLCKDFSQKLCLHKILEGLSRWCLHCQRSLPLGSI